MFIVKNMQLVTPRHPQKSPWDIVPSENDLQEIDYEKEEGIFQQVVPIGIWMNSSPNAIPSYLSLCNNRSSYIITSPMRRYFHIFSLVVPPVKGIRYIRCSPVKEHTHTTQEPTSEVLHHH